MTLLRRTQVVVAVLSIFFCFLYIFAIYGGPVDPSRPVGVKETEELFFIPKDWTGLPVSTRNHLFVKSTNRTRSDILAFREDLYNMDSTDGWSDGTWKDILELHLPKIGFNGIIEGIDKASLARGFRRDLVAFHELGSLIAERSRGNPEFAMQIVARDVMKRAPLHGAVWYFIENYESNIPQEIVDYANEVCYFKDYSGMLITWNNCIHGFGHGIMRKYNNSSVHEQLAVCGLDKSADFVYSCATGIMMDLVKKYDDQLEFCDTVPLYPGSCYRFLTFYYADGNIPCTHITDEYHARGCFFGKGFVSGYESCKDYAHGVVPHEHYMACLDGGWMKYKHAYDNSAFCNDNFSFDNTTRELSACLQKMDSSSGKWNWNILENI